MEANSTRRCGIAVGRFECQRALSGIAAAILIAAVNTLPAHGAVIVLSPSQAGASGIVTVPLLTTQYRPQIEGIATVVDPEALTALAAQLAMTHAAVEAANEAVASATAQAKRLERLYRDDKSVSERDEQAAIATAAAAKAQRVSAAAAELSARASAQTSWGASLAAAAQQGPDAFADYADGRRMLLAVALPVGISAMPANDIQILRPDGQTLTALLIGPSPRADAIVQGLTYYYWAAGNGLRSGQRFAAAVPINLMESTGVVVPDAAVLWYAGEPWVYIETSPGHFVRRSILIGARDTKGWFQAKGFRAGESVVVSGNELLLSQELKPPPSAASANDQNDD